MEQEAQKPQLNKGAVIERSEQFYCWAVVEYGSEKRICKKQCKACQISSKQ